MKTIIISANITSASTRNVDAVTKSCEKIATFAPASIPSFGDAATRRPVTTGVNREKKKYNSPRLTVGVDDLVKQSR